MPHASVPGAFCPSHAFVCSGLSGSGWQWWSAATPQESPASDLVRNMIDSSGGGYGSPRAPVSGTIPCNDDQAAREQRSVGVGGVSES